MAGRMWKPDSKSMKKKSRKLSNDSSRNWPPNTTWCSSPKWPEAGRFMESRHIQRPEAHRDHEPGRLLSRPAGTLSSAASGGEGRGEEGPLTIRFMERRHLQH